MNCCSPLSPSYWNTIFFIFCISLNQNTQVAPWCVYLCICPTWLQLYICGCFYVHFHKINLSAHSNIWEFHQHILIMYLLLIMLLYSAITERTPSYLPLNFKACFWSSMFESKFILFHLVWVCLRRQVLESWPWIQWGLHLAHLPAFKFSSGVASHSNYILNKSISYTKVCLQRYVIVSVAQVSESMPIFSMESLVFFLMVIQWPQTHLIPKKIQSRKQHFPEMDQ